MGQNFYLRFALILSVQLLMACGSGFKSADYDQQPQCADCGWDPVPQMEGTQAKVLIGNPFLASKNSNLAFTTDVTPYLTYANTVTPKTDQAFLATDKFKIDVDDAYPNQFADPKGSLIFPATDPRFLQVNVYFHINRLLLTLEKLKIFPSEFVADLSVNAHCTKSIDNAYYSSGEKLICMGYADSNGEKLWSGYDSDIIVHELGHAINDAVVTDGVLESNMEMWSLDEGFGDVWAYLTNDQAKIATWYDKAIQGVQASAGGDDRGGETQEGMRDLAKVLNYPISTQFESHADGLFFSAIFYELRIAGVEKSQLHTLAMRLLEDLQEGDTYADVARHFLDESKALSDAIYNLAKGALQKRGLLRKDSMEKIEITDKDLLVVDGHFESIQKGNCNKSLDEGEVALLIPNFTNSGAAQGSFKYKVTSSSADLEVVVGRGQAMIPGLKFAGSSVTTVIPIDESRKANLSYAAVIVSAKKAGSYTLTLEASAFNSLDGTSVKRSYPLPITVGSAPIPANLRQCAGDIENAVWP